MSLPPVTARGFGTGYAPVSPQWFQWVISVTGGRFAGRKLVPLV